ncbi:MAG: sensor domain-containing diguanylate cyclase [Actinomycetota bacterium]|nr:sensor domain-containing diguanylate cyclase [Actinomycetota bacterium]
MTERARARLRRGRGAEPVEAPERSKRPAGEGHAAARFSHRPFGAQMHALRFGFIGIVAWSAGLSDTITAAPRTWIGGLLAYGLLILVADRSRRIWTRSQAPVALLMLFVDGAFLAWVLFLSGGALSPLRFLVYIHLISTTLIYTYRVGVAVTLMHSILFFAVFRAQAAGVVDFQGVGVGFTGIGEGALGARDSWIFNTVVLWLVALATAPFSSVNDRELRRRKDDLGALAEMANDFENLHSPQEMAQSMLERLNGSFQFDRGAVLAVREDHLVLVAGREVEKTMAPTATIDKLIDKAWDGHEALLVARLDPEMDPCLARLMPDARNVLVTPMFADGQPFGVLVVESSNVDQPVIQRRVISMVMQFAAHGALAMRNAWLLQQVQSLADTDALTGVANRRSFEKAITRDVSRSIRSGEPLTLVMIDLDYFKQLNDMFGHQAGDEVLRRVGAVLRGACRGSDVPARYGGEEFAVLLPACGKEEAFAAAQRLRYLIAGIEAPVPISASAGVATYPVHATTPEGLVAAADEALYQSKRMGRNRTTVSPRRVLRAVRDVEVV